MVEKFNWERVLAIPRRVLAWWALLVVWTSTTIAAREPLILDATAVTFHFSRGYAVGRSPAGPLAVVDNWRCI